MNRQEKDQFVSTMTGEITSAAAAMFVDFTGLNVETVENFRRKVRAADLKYTVVKNTLMKRVLNDCSIKDSFGVLHGTPTGVVLGFDDPVRVAKITCDFAAECEHLKIKGGILEGNSLNAKEALALSKMPGKSELQASILLLALSPGRNVLGQIKTPAGKIVGAIDKLVEMKEQGDA